MASPAALWFQRLPAGLRRRLDLAEAAAREDRINTHASQALDLVAVLAPRMPFDEAVERYLEMMSLDGDDAEMVHTRALKLLSDRQSPEALARSRPRGSFDWRYLTPGGALRYVQRQRRRTAEEDLWVELAAARAEEALIRTHVEHARIFVDLLEAETDPSRATSLYLDRVAEPESRSRAIYQRVLALLAETLLPRIIEYGRDEEAHAARVQ